MTTAIIGAGISGLLLARQLQSRGGKPVVLEKSRGYGGRLATKRLGDAVLDSGAQFLTAREPAFQELVAGWTHAGLLAPWTASGAGRFVGRPAMTAVPKALAEGLDIRREHRATAVRRVEGRWEIVVVDRPSLAADRLVLTCPVPQALALLDAGAVALPAALRTELDALTYHPCLAALVVLSGPSRVPPGGFAPESGPLRWIADNAAKGVGPSGIGAVTLHATPDWSRARYDAPEADVLAELVAVARPWLGEAPVAASALHRWKFSEPRATFRERSLWLPELSLGFAGDSFGGPKVEGAALSGLDLAARLA
jgi:predicted NAD/FAD-dependent oxidoreductase